MSAAHRHLEFDLRLMATGAIAALLEQTLQSITDEVQIKVRDTLSIAKGLRRIQIDSS